MVNLCLDSSILVEYLRTNDGIFAKILRDPHKKRYRLNIPAIVVFELFRGQSINNKKHFQHLTKLTNSMQAVNLTLEMAICAGKLHREGLVKGNDALIAATCLEHNLTLVTLNTKHFLHIPKLKLYQPK